MTKIIHLIYIHLLSLFGINRVVKNVHEGESARFEFKTILFIIISLLYCFLFYILLQTFFTDGFLILPIAFLFSSIFCLLYDFNQVKAILFQAEDTLFLFSLPIDKKEIVLSKLFTIYFKNIFFAFLFMISALLAARFTLLLNQTFILLFLVMILFIPVLPIVIASICFYANSYFKMHFLKLRVALFISIFVVLCFFLFFILPDVYITRSNIMFLISKLCRLYPISYLFSQSLSQMNLFLFFAYLMIHIGIIYLYIVFLSFDYPKICSVMRGRKKKSFIVYKKRSNKKRFFGLVHKELVYLFSYSLYFKNSYSLTIIGSIFLVFMFLILPYRSYDSFLSYFNLFGPLVLSVIASLGLSGIHAFSLERKNLDMLGSFPVSFGQVFFAKMLTNFLLLFVLILFNATFLMLVVKPNTFVIVMLYVLPIFVSLFHIFFSLLLDSCFIDKANQSESAIIKERLLPIVPIFLSFSYLVFPFLFPNVLGYKYILGSLLVISISEIICCLLFYFVARRKLIRKIFYS